MTARARLGSAALQLARLGLGAALGGCVLSSAVTARADISSWIAVSGGVGRFEHERDDELVPTLRVETGMGSTPRGPMVVGGTFLFAPAFGHGTDLGLALRGATRGYVTGGVGVALDLGPYLRVGHVSRGGFGQVALGLPWGLIATGGASLGDHEARAYQGTFGFDFARLTVFRATGDRWWKNPLPPTPRDDE